MNKVTEQAPGVDKGGHCPPPGGKLEPETPYENVKLSTSRTRCEDVHAGGGGHCPPLSTPPSTLYDPDVDRLARRIYGLLPAPPDGLTSSDLRRRTASRDRHLLDAATDLLIGTGLATQDDERPKRYWRSGAPPRGTDDLVWNLRFRTRLIAQQANACHDCSGALCDYHRGCRDALDLAASWGGETR